MKDALAGGPMADGAVDTILQAINDMQDKINSDFDEKLRNYVPMPLFQDAENEAKAQGRRIAHNESQIKEYGQTMEANIEKIENNRKKLTKLQSDLENLKNQGGRSATNLVEEAPMVDSAGDGEGGADLGKLQKYI